MAKTKSNLRKYVNNFFRKVKLYDDRKEFYDVENKKHYHNYKGLLKAAIDVFLDYQSTYTAYDVYETFLMIYQITPEDKSEVDENSPTSLISEPNTLLDLVDTMRKYEENTGDLINWQRDHFVHSVNVFILGLAIYAQNENYRKIFKKYILDNKSNYNKYYRYKNNWFSHEEFLYRWGVAALFHDIGYPYEIIKKQLDKIVEDDVKSISLNYNDVKTHFNFKNFNEFNSIVRIPPFDYADKFRESYERTKVLDLFKPTDIMAHKIALDFNLDDDKFKLVEKHLNGFVEFMNEKNFIDHGYFSAILVLNYYGKLIQKYVDKNKDFFFYPIVDSATAILLHNYYHETLQDESLPFKLERMDPANSPIAYLLIFCDELQEWNRQPYGVMDKKKNHVNDFDVEISNEEMTVYYILKSGSMGLGFESEKGEKIKKILDDKAIFEDSFCIQPHVELDDVQRDIMMYDVEAPDVLLRNIEKMAMVINQQYNLKVKGELEEAKKAGDKKKIKEYTIKEKSTRSFKKLDPSLKMSNLRQAKSIPKKLAMIGCEIAHKTEKEWADTTDFTEKVNQLAKDHNDDDEIIEYDGKSVRILRFSKGDINDLAICEHNDWMRERLGMGWVYGHYDAKNKVNNNLVEWDRLGEDIQEFDKDAVRNIPLILDKIGLKIVRSKLRALTYKMNQFYENGKLDENDSGEEKFKGLDKHIQFSNLKQAEHLVRILRDKGYELVAKTDLGEPVSEFEENEIEHFAKREHELWYKLKLNLNQTQSDNFVGWDELHDDVKEKNRDTFRFLHDICDDEFVGLKIVKNE